MPIYEYRCQGCGREVDLLLREPQKGPSCPHCGATLTRVFSSFAIGRTDRDVYESILSDSSLIRAMERNDPKALAEWNRRLSRGEPVAPEYQDMVEKMEQGELPTPPPKEKGTE